MWSMSDTPNCNWLLLVESVGLLTTRATTVDTLSPIKPRPFKVQVDGKCRQMTKNYLQLFTALTSSYSLFTNFQKLVLPPLVGNNTSLHFFQQTLAHRVASSKKIDPFIFLHLMLFLSLSIMRFVVSDLFWNCEERVSDLFFSLLHCMDFIS